MTYEDILARMRKGETADDIADEMAKMLNKAQKQVAEEARTNQKEEDYKFACGEAADAMNEALAAYATWKNVDVSGLSWDADMCANIVDVVVNFKDLLTVLGVTEDKKAGRETKAHSGDDTFDATVSKFFKEFGIT